MTLSEAAKYTKSVRHKSETTCPMCGKYVDYMNRSDITCIQSSSDKVFRWYHNQCITISTRKPYRTNLY